MSKQFEKKIVPEGWSEISFNEIDQGDHIRYTKNKYKAKGRSCVYAVVKRIDDRGTVWVNAYKNHDFNDWKLSPNCKFRMERYYKRDSISGIPVSLI